MTCRSLVVSSAFAVLVGSLGLQPAEGQPPPRTTSRFQRPAAERRVEAGSRGAPAGRGRRAGGVAGASRRASGSEGSLEQQQYLRERPDAPGLEDVQDERLEALLRSREELLRVRRGQAIELLEAFVRSEPEEAPEMADALLRLAELRWEEAREAYLRAFEAWQKVPEENRGPEPRPDYRTALALLDRILERHRDFPRYDLVLYLKAFALAERGEGDAALDLYRRIIASFPRSRFVPDAHFALAEAAFGAGDFEAALEEYDRVLAYQETELGDLALFKGAWCLWKMGRTEQAAVRFRKVLDLSEQAARLRGARRRRLRELQDEALGYLIQVFTEDEKNTAADVFDFLEDIGGEKYAYRLLRRLAVTYADQGRYDRAVEAYGLLVEMDASAPQVPSFLLAQADAYALDGQADPFVETLLKAAETVAEGSEWVGQQGDPRIVAEARDEVASALRRHALRFHEWGQKRNLRRAFERAEALYAAWLEHFADRPEAYELAFYRAEILFHRLHRWREAGEAYLWVAHRDPKGRFTRDALYNAIGAFERIREKEIQRCVAAREQGEGQQEACAESDNDRRFSEAIELYVQLFPQDPDLPEILYRQGRLYYDRGIYDPAVRLFGQLLERFPRSEYAVYAGELILESFKKARDYRNIEQWARRLKGAEAFQKPELQRRLDTLILQSIFKIGEQLAGRGEHAEAAQAYLRAADEFPRDERAPKALYNAALERARAGDFAGSIEAYDALLERYPRSEEAALAAWSAAQRFESIAQFGDAARYYELYAERFPGKRKAFDALYNAVLLRLSAEQLDRAVQDGERFLTRYGRRAEADDVAFFVARAHEGLEHWDAAARTYRQVVRGARSLDRKVEAQARLGQVLLKAGNRRAARTALQAAVKTGKRQRRNLRDGLYYAAQAQFQLAELVMADYEAISIAGEMRGLRERLQRKAALLQSAARLYAQVVEFGVPEWVTAALFRIGRGYELFAEALRDAPIPEELNEEERQVYQDELMAFVVPMEERALEAYEGGYQKALQMRIFNRWTAKLREGLTRLNDVQYPPLREAGGRIVERVPLPEAPMLRTLAPRGGAGGDGR